MPYLLELDASHNQLTTLLDFKPPNNLKIVDVSYNEISEMADLSAHHYLLKLVIDSILYCVCVFVCVEEKGKIQTSDMFMLYILSINKS